MTTRPAIQIGSRFLGEGYPLIAAEIGINHNGDLDLAREMIMLAAKAGADGVKFQNYRTDDFFADRSMLYRDISMVVEVVESQYDMFKRYEMPREWLPELKKCCDENDVIFFSTPTSRQGIDDLLEIGSPLFKNGSDYLGNLPLISDFARSDIPTVLSTGMAEQVEIDAAVEAYRSAGGTELVLLHCTSSYPTPLEAANVSRMNALKDRYQCLVGFSDHTEGHIASGLAVAMGAVFVEKHFTTDRNLPGPDHMFSSTPSDFRKLFENIRLIEMITGDSSIVSADCEQSSRYQFRLSCRASRPLPTGTVLARGDIAISRPGDGLEPSYLENLIGSTLNNPLEQGQAIRTDDIAGDLP